MMIADDAALAEGPAAGEDFVGTIRRNLAQDEGKPPAEGGVAGRIRRILLQEGARFGHGEGFAVLLEGPRALVVVLRGVGGLPTSVKERLSKLYRYGRVLLRDLGVERAGKNIHEVRQVQLEVGSRQREARGVAQSERVLGDLHIEREGGRAGRRAAGESGRGCSACSLGSEIALQRTQTEFGMELGNRAQLGPGLGERRFVSTCKRVKAGANDAGGEQRCRLRAGFRTAG